MIYQKMSEIKQSVGNGDQLGIKFDGTYYIMHMRDPLVIMGTYGLYGNS